MATEALAQWFASHPSIKAQATHPDLLRSLSALTDPKQLNTQDFASLMNALIESRPHEEKSTLLHGIGTAILRALGMGMNGLTLQDPFVRTPGNPDKPGQQNTFFVSPWPRPTAGACTIPTYRDHGGNLYMLLVRDKIKRDDGTLTDAATANWQTSGGFMDACDPATHDPIKNPDGTANPGHPRRSYDLDLEATAIRELREETGLTTDAAVSSHLVSLKTGYRPPRHHISACFLLDFGLRDAPPPVGPQEETFDVRWVNVRDISYAPDGMLQTSIDGTTRLILSRHAPDFGEAITLARRNAKPGFDSIHPPFSSEATDDFSRYHPESMINAATATHGGRNTALTSGSRWR